jgi:DNA-binding CsgD family transcriptional regulator
MEHLGYDRVNFSIMNDRDLAPANHGFGLISTYPDDWQRYYAEQQLQKIDPVVRFAVGNHQPFRWKDIEKGNDLSRRQVNFFREGETAGLHNGVGIPFAGPNHQAAGVALATSIPQARQLRNLDLLAAFANHFYTVYKRLAGMQNSARPPLAILTEREQEVLIRVAHGRTDLEIAHVLSIHPRTVDFHLQNIYAKLDVKTRAAAVAVALKSWLIEY